MRSSWVRALAMCCVLGASTVWSARAAAEGVELDWQAPAECGSSARVQAELTRLLGARREQLSTAAVEARAEVTRRAGRYQLQLWVSTHARGATRELEAARCDELVEAAAWLIALAVDPMLTAPAPEQRAEPSRTDAAAGGATARAASAARPPTSQASSTPADGAAGRPASTASASASAAATERAPARSRPRAPVKLGLHVGAQAGLFAGGGADVQAAVSGLLGLSANWSYSQLRVSAYLPRDLALTANASAELWSWALGLSQCALWGRALRGGPCAVLTGLRTSVETRGVNPDQAREQVLWATAGPGFMLHWRVWHGLELTAAGHVGIPISPRPRFSVDPLGTVISAEPWCVDAQLGVSFAYP